MVHRMILLLVTLGFCVNPAYSTEPDLERVNSNDRGSIEEFDEEAPVPAPSRTRAFARNGQFRGGAVRPGRLNGPATRGRMGGFNWRRQALEYQTEEGFVFIDRVSIEAPYRVESRNRELFLNDISLADPPMEVESDQSAIQPSMDADRLYEQLDSDRVAIKFSGSEIVCFDEASGDKLLALLTLDRNDRRSELSAVLELVPPNQNREEWSNWLLEFETSEALKQRIRDREAHLADTKAKTTRLLMAEKAMEDYSYPLTILGMIVVVLAVGYLLAFNPSMAQLLPEQVRAAQLSKSVQYSVILIVVMSGLDLAWTLLSSSVGLMKELNPVGSDLISDPDSLVKFKMAATLLAAGVFLSMRKFRSAQLASWWMCIVCTLVSARWLVFNSMYMG